MAVIDWSHRNSDRMTALHEPAYAWVGRYGRQQACYRVHIAIVLVIHDGSSDRPTVHHCQHCSIPGSSIYLAASLGAAQLSQAAALIHNTCQGGIIQLTSTCIWHRRETGMIVYLQPHCDLHRQQVSLLVPVALYALHHQQLPYWVADEIRS